MEFFLKLQDLRVGMEIASIYDDVSVYTVTAVTAWMFQLKTKEGSSGTSGWYISPGGFRLVSKLDKVLE